MGYTHYWEFNALDFDEWAEAWPTIVKDAEEIVKAAMEWHVAIAGPMGDGEPEFSEDYGIALNGSSELDEDYETFELLPFPNAFAFCKTALRPYDLVVTAILRHAHALVPALKISSDGDDEAWVEADKLLSAMRLQFLAPDEDED